MDGSRSAFQPKVMFFYTSKLRDAKDWESCFHVKAAAVYSIMTGKKADKGAASIASTLLVSIAEKCASSDTRHLERAPSVAVPPPPGATGTAAGKQPDSRLTDQRPIAKEDNSQKLSAATAEAIDAVYLLVCVLRDLKINAGEPSPDREKLDTYYAATRRQDNIADVIKVENQLPLALLRATAGNFLKAMGEAVKSLKDVITDKGVITSIENFDLRFNQNNFHDMLHLFCWYYSPLYTKTPPSLGGSKAVVDRENLLDCLHSTLVDGLASIAAGGGSRPMEEPPLPTATQLVKHGIFLKATEDNKIGGIKFDNSILQLPAVVLDAKLEVVAVNLLEWERLRKGEDRPVARYFMLLKELVDEDHDVRALGNCGVLRGRWKKEDEVVGLLRRVERFASCPWTYQVVDDVVGMVRAAHEKSSAQAERKVWLPATVRNRPAVWASSAALLSLLLAALFASRRRA